MNNDEIFQDLLLKAIQQLQETSAAMNEALATLRNSRESARKESGGADKRLFVEIWEHIFAFLYPSQIARLSRTSRTMHGIISASSYWPRLFKRIFGPDYQLDTLAAMPEATSHMRYLCAVSGRICENCWRYFPPPKAIEDIAARPLPFLVPNALVLPRNNCSKAEREEVSRKRKRPSFLGRPNNMTLFQCVCNVAKTTTATVQSLFQCSAETMYMKRM